MPARAPALQIKTAAFAAVSYPPRKLLVKVEVDLD